MLTFNVGPSKISTATKRDIQKASDKGVLEISHRSEEFSRISAQAILGLREFFQIPKDYRIFYASSATEAMQLALGNCCEKASFHFVSGNFSGLFAKVSKSLGKKEFVDLVLPGKQNDFSNVSIGDAVDFVSITHNETSTGVMCKASDIKTIRKKYPQKILAVDITSSAALEKFSLKDADIWLFSVQKGFGLPSGLGLLFVSPRAFEKSLVLQNKGNNSAGYFSFANMWGKMEGKFQTLQTPNILGIYLLAQKLKRWNAKGGAQAKIAQRDEKWKVLHSFFASKKDLEFFPQDKKCFSKSVFCIKADRKKIEKYHRALKREGIISGKGYGDLKETTFRIANFPAITKKDVEKYIQATDKIFQ